jgi:hypothetical protein
MASPGIAGAVCVEGWSVKSTSEHVDGVAPVRGSRGRWAPGSSGNTRGRPRKGSALADALRSKCDPEELATIALEIARSGASESVRIQALQFIASSGFVRPEQRHELVMGVSDDEPDLRSAALV